MALVDHTLFGVVDKVQIAIDRLRQYEPPEGYYLAFSGGKDSTVLYELAKMSGVKFDAHMNMTSVDPPELIYHVRRHYPDVEIHRPEITMWKLIPEKQFPPSRIKRYCCWYLKEQGGKERQVVATGVRWEESSRRKKRQIIEGNKGGSGAILNPVIDWTTLEVWDFIKERGLPYCSLYDEGFKRLGCVGCPMAGTKGMLKEFARWPKYRDAYLRAFGRMIAARRAKGKDIDKESKWNTPEEVMDWWIYAQGKGGKGDLCDGYADQTVLFE
jgi:phosphoadenosine phosphosulfate reductase